MAQLGVDLFLFGQFEEDEARALVARAPPAGVAEALGLLPAPAEAPAPPKNPWGAQAARAEAEAASAAELAAARARAAKEEQRAMSELRKPLDGAVVAHRLTHSLRRRPSMAQQVKPGPQTNGRPLASAPGRGLYNLGNTCFANAVVQCLVRAPLLAPLWPTVLEQVECLQKAGHVAELSSMALASELAQLANGLRTADASDPISPDQFILLTRGYFERQGFANSVNAQPHPSGVRVTVTAPQQDAHEFLEWLLDRLDEEQQALLRLADSDAQASAAGDGSQVDATLTTAADDDAWEEVGRKGRSSGPAQRVGGATQGVKARETFVTSVFQGTLRSIVRTVGAKDSVTLQPFMCLQLDMFKPSVRTVEDALELYMSPEMLTGLRTERHPGTEQRGQKLLLFDKLPQVLILHLKRFVFSQQTGSAEKLQKTMGYPAELVLPESYFSAPLSAALQVEAAVLSGQQAASESGPPAPAWGAAASSVPRKFRTYRLFAVCLHRGEHAVRGHYTAFACDAAGTWTEYDDRTARALTSRDILNHPEAYLLFYARENVST